MYLYPHFFVKLQSNTHKDSEESNGSDFFSFLLFFSFDDAVLVFAKTLTILPAEAAQGSKSLLNQWLSVNINPSRPDHGQREKNNLNFYFHTSLWCTLLKAFIKPFEALQRSVKIKF